MNKNCLAIVIVNWNSGLHLEKCINSIFKYKIKSLSKVIIVDNNSSDNSLDFLKFNTEDNIFVFFNKINLGFSKACNQGAKQADKDTRYFLFLNPDTILSEGCIDKSVYFLDKKSNQNFGICGIALNNSDKITASCFRFPSLKLLITEALGISKINPKYGRQMFEWNHNSIRKVDQVIGAYFMVRKDLFETLNGFDERFFVYYEEVDFSLRAKKEGFYSIFNNELSCYHYGGGTTEKIKAERLFLSLKSRLIYFKKHFSKSEYFLAKFFTLIIEPISRFIFILVKMKWVNIFSLIKAYKKLIYSIKEL